MNWKATLIYADDTVDVLYYHTKAEAKSYEEFYSNQSRTPGTHIGKRLVSSRIERNN